MDIYTHAHTNNAYTHTDTHCSHNHTLMYTHLCTHAHTHCSHRATLTYTQPCTHSVSFLLPRAQGRGPRSERGLSSPSGRVPPACRGPWSGPRPAGITNPANCTRFGSGVSGGEVPAGSCSQAMGRQVGRCLQGAGVGKVMPPRRHSKGPACLAPVPPPRCRGCGGGRGRGRGNLPLRPPCLPACARCPGQRHCTGVRQHGQGVQRGQSAWGRAVRGGTGVSFVWRGSSGAGRFCGRSESLPVRPLLPGSGAVLPTSPPRKAPSPDHSGPAEGRRWREAETTAQAWP